jgi:hypothetical protein
MTDQAPDDGRLEHALHARRPAPSPRFADDLRDHLLELDARERRPPYLWAMVAAYACAGVLLLVVAAIAAAGGGL